MRSLITGAGGFAGSHLADYLAAQPETAVDLWGCDLTSQRRAYHPPSLQLLAADLCDPDAARAVLQEVRPQRIYHLAGQAFVGESWADPWATYEANVRAQLNLLEAMRSLRLEARILVLGSNEEYGRLAAADLPVSEAGPLRPDSPYGVSKIGQDLMGLQYHLSYQMHVIRVRPFNHIGPRQNPKFVAPAFAAQIAAIEAGRQPPVLRVGNLSARRDFTDVRDMVRAYGLALEHGTPGAVYNLGSGRSYAIQEILDRLLSFSTAAITVEIDPARLRPSDVPDMVCNAGAFQARTGWTPRIPLDQTLRELLDFERARLKG